MSAITFSCHACNRSMRVGIDKAGRKAKCPQCGTVLTIPEPPLEELEPIEAVPEIEPAPRGDRRRERDDDFDDRDRDEPRDRRRDRDRDGRYGRDQDDRDDDRDDRRSRPAKGKTDWGRVHLGMKLCWHGSMVLLISFGVNLLGSIFLTIESLRDNPNLFDAFRGFSALFTIGAIITRLAFLGMLVGMILILIGEIFWFWVQNKHATLGFAIASVSVAGFAVLCFLGYQANLLMTFFTPMTFLGSGLSFSIWVLGVQFILAALFFRAFGRLVDDETVEIQAKTLLIFGSVVAGYQIVSQIIGIAVYNPFAIVLNFGAGPSFGARLTLTIIYWLGAVPTGILLFLHMGICKRGIRLSR